MDPKPEDTGFKRDALPLAIFIGLMLAIMFYVFPRFLQPPDNPILVPLTNGHLTNQQLVVLGKPLENKEAKEVLARIKNDLKIDKKIVTLEGPYWVVSRILAASFPELQMDGYSFSRYYIIVDSDFYQTLNSEEKKAVIAHEMGHIDGIQKIIKMEIDADSFAAKYVSPQTFIDLLNKVAPNKVAREISKEYRLRMENLERIKQLQQGH